MRAVIMAGACFEGAHADGVYRMLVRLQLALLENWQLLSWRVADRETAPRAGDDAGCAT